MNIQGQKIAKAIKIPGSKPDKRRCIKCLEKKKRIDKLKEKYGREWFKHLRVEEEEKT